MTNNQNINKKVYILVIIFLMFWSFTSLFILFPKLTSKFSSINWVYSQTFPQSWSFFTQPAIYNDRLIVVTRDSNEKIIDSVDVLKTLWDNKRAKFNYSYENIWDHIMYRSIRDLREKINSAQITFYSEDDIFKQINYYELLLPQDNYFLLQNIENFSKKMLSKDKLTKAEEFQLLLYTDYINPFDTINNLPKKQLAFKTGWIFNTSATR